MAMSYQENRKAVFEGTDKQAYQSFKQEIIRFKASGLRLDSIVDAGVMAGVNMVKNSVSLNRLNALALALRDCKENSRLSRLARVPAYMGMENCVSYNKENGVFVITDYATCKAIAQNMKMPSVKFLAWCKENKASKENSPLTEKQAAQKIRNLFIAMRDSHYINSNPQFSEILDALRNHVETMDADYQAMAELEKMRNILA